MSRLFCRLHEGGGMVRREGQALAPASTSAKMSCDREPSDG
jgi:hypothetical protein